MQAIGEPNGSNSERNSDFEWPNLSALFQTTPPGENGYCDEGYSISGECPSKNSREFCGSFDKIPPEVMLHVMHYLDVRSLVSTTQVNRQWYELADEDSLWVFLYFTHWPDPFSCHKTSGNRTYKHIFREAYIQAQQARSHVLSRKARMEKMSREESISMKVLILGDPCTGKTSLILRAVNQLFIGPDYQPTIYEDRYDLLIVQNHHRISIAICDVPPGRNAQDCPMSWGCIDACMLCFSLLAPETLANVLEYWVPMVKRIHGNDLPLVLCGTSTDIAYPISHEFEEQIELAAKALGCPYVETSAKTGTGVVSAFTNVAQVAVPPSTKVFESGPSLSSYFPSNWENDDDGSDSELDYF